MGDIRERGTAMSLELRRAIKVKLMLNDVSQTEFAKRVGVTRNHLYGVLAGERPCGRVTMLRIMDVLEKIGTPPPEPPEGVTPNVRGL